MVTPQYLSLKTSILSDIKKAGGWVNCHAHIDRAYSLSSKNFRYTKATLQEKWDLNDSMKRNSTVNQIYDRMAYATEEMLRQNVKVLGTFIDIDEIIKDKSINAAVKLREKYKKDLTIKFINQSHKGVIDKNASYWFRLGSEFVDIIGGLPEKDKGREKEHIEILFDTAKKLNKMVHVHIDQFNSPLQKDTELLCDLIIKRGLVGKVAGIHGLSLSAQPVKYRKKVYEKMKKAKYIQVVCPSAWIDSRRTEELAVTHNSIAPVEELVAEKITVALGTDNIYDIYKPFSDGNMWTELRFLLESCHLYDQKELVKISTANGRKALGLSR